LISGVSQPAYWMFWPPETTNVESVPIRERLSGAANVESPGVHIFACVLLSNYGGTWTPTHHRHTAALPPDQIWRVRCSNFYHRRAVA
jgi:hypothetical protein